MQGTHFELTRQESLQIWMRRNNRPQRLFAANLGLSEAALSRMLRADSISSRRHAELVRLGIPPELLPPAEEKRGGPKRVIALPA